jgi:hypothetical protein
MFRQSLRESLNKTKKLVISGVVFHIRKIDAIDYLNGSKVLWNHFSTYEDLNKINKDQVVVSDKKIREHYIDVLMSGVVKPELTRDQKDETKIHINEVFKDYKMVEKLYSEIINYTFGKKKHFSHPSLTQG